MEEKPKSSGRRTRLLLSLVLLIQIVAYLLVLQLFDFNIILYLVGLNFIIALVRIKKEPIFPLRWGYRVALLSVIGLVMLLFYVQGQQIRSQDTEGTVSAAFVTKGYVRQVLMDIYRRMGVSMQPPHELFQWRDSGRFDREPTFAKSTLCWLTYNATEHSFQYHAVDSLAFDLHVFDARVRASLDSALNINAIRLGRQYHEQGREYSVRGRFFSGEPRFVGTIMDVEAFNRRDVPEILAYAQENFPSLHEFTQEKIAIKRGKRDHSQLTIRFKDKDGQILAQIGSLREYENKPIDKHVGYILRYPDNPSPGTKIPTFEAIVPYSLEMDINRTDRVIQVATFLLVLAVLIAWVKTEVQLSQTRKKLGEKKTVNTKA